MKSLDYIGPDFLIEEAYFRLRRIKTYFGFKRCTDVNLWCRINDIIYIKVETDFGLFFSRMEIQKMYAEYVLFSRCRF